MPQQAQHSATVVAYPAPAQEPLSPDYRVQVNGQHLDVYLAKTQHHDGKYAFASFDFAGEVEVRVTASGSLKGAEILPASSGLKPALAADGSLRFTATQPFKISIERDGENNPLLLFANPLEEHAPQAGDPGVVYFGPGIHRPGKIVLTDGQTLYLAGGAVVKAGVEARGNHIRILGRGMLDGTDWPHFGGPTCFMLWPEKCDDIEIRDIIIRGSWGWTIVPCGCDGVTITNVKLCGSRVDNDDGIDPVNSRHVTVRDCFLRTDDDCIAIKGMRGYDNQSCEHIVVENCTFWTDRANVFRIGYECEAAAMRHITARNIDVIHFVGCPQPAATLGLSPRHPTEPPVGAEGSFGDANAPTRPSLGPALLDFWSTWVFYLQPSNDMPMTDLRFEDIRINAVGENNDLIKILPMWTGWGGVENGKLTSGDYDRPGRCVRDCHFRNIEIGGKAGGLPGRIYIAGADAEHVVEDITLDHILRFGAPTRADSPEVFIGAHVERLAFR